VLTLGNKERFQRSRDVGCYLGLRPRRSQSGDSDPQLGITKAGNGYDCARGWALTEADRKLATSLLLLDLNQHRAKGSYKAFLNPRNAIRKNLREW
jgi:transposase